MRLLLLTPRLPFPPVGGDKLRIFTYIQHLAGEHDLSLISFIAHPREREKLKPYRHLFSSVELVHLSRSRSMLNCALGLFSDLPLQVHYYWSRQMQLAVERKLRTERFDLVLVHLIRMAEYVRTLGGVTKVIELTDALSLTYTRASRHRRSAMKLVDMLERERVKRYEVSVLDHFDRSVMISPVDRAFLWSLAGRDGIDVVPISVNTDYFQYYDGPYDPHSVVFVGNMRTFPNQDSAVYFAREVLPLCRRLVPGMRFTIVGVEPGREVWALRRLPGVEVTGPVQDIRPHLRNALASVCPMRVGAGAKNKVLESMAIGTPVVATPTGVEGVDVVPGENALIATTPAAFAQNLARLVRDPDLRRRLARNGRQMVEHRYAVDKAMSALDTVLGKATRQRAPAAAMLS